MKLKFCKYQGAGNDFVMIDNRELIFNREDNRMVAKLCDRRFGIGGDGLMLLEDADGFDFKMTYFNSDGFEASMCGNGGRCIVAFARHLGIINKDTRFLAADGIHEASIDSEDLIDLHLNDVDQITVCEDGFFLNTGVPHFVKFVDDLSAVDVASQGRDLRYDVRFQPAGTNVNFVHQRGSYLEVFTYERGVECETLACGTGVTASALSAAYKTGMLNGQFDISAKGGNLVVRFGSREGKYTDVWLKGPAVQVFEGIIEL
jgi:diaminopimelate epimerase